MKNRFICGLFGVVEKFNIVLNFLKFGLHRGSYHRAITEMSYGMTRAKMSGDKMTNGMTEHFRFISPGKLTDGINLTDKINLTDDYKTSLRINKLILPQLNTGKH